MNLMRGNPFLASAPEHAVMQLPFAGARIFADAATEAITGLVAKQLVTDGHVEAILLAAMAVRAASTKAAQRAQAQRQFQWPERLDADEPDCTEMGQ